MRAHLGLSHIRLLNESPYRVIDEVAVVMLISLGEVEVMRSI